MTSRTLVRWIAALQVLVLVVYTWYFTTGYWTHLPEIFSWDLYDRLASAFAAGDLHLEESPAPDLLALADPYSIQSRKDVSSYIGDATLYEGRYYLYWGPVPAVLIALAKVAGLHARIGDAALVMVFVSGVFLLLSALLSAVWRRHFADLPPWTLLVALPVLGFAPPLAWMLNNPLNYEAALASAEFFLLAGLLSGYLALTRPGHREGLFMIAGGACALAIGCQFTQVIAVAGAIVLLGAWIALDPSFPTARKRVQAVLAVSLPTLGMLLMLGFYNYARFGSPTEFGYRFQLAVVNLHVHYAEIFQPIFAIPNAYNYLLMPFLTSRSFPFVYPQYGSIPQGLPFQIPTLYYSEAITGLVYSAPVLIFAAVPLVSWSRGLGRTSPRDLFERAVSKPLHWLVCAITFALVPNLGVLLFFYYSAPRYLMAVVPLLLVLSALGFWMSYRKLNAARHGRRLVVAAAGLLSAWTVIVSLLLAVSSSQDRFAQGNPELLHAIERLLSGI